ncbi:MAG: hypothetical protein M3461_07570 [Pseudomonadota bacterium]|nr:hypothetical protein [Pseudomonadota bacterium]
MNVSHLAEADPLRREFTVDHETGRPAISTRRSLERVVACHASGLFVTDRWRRHNARTGIAAHAARFLSDHTVAVDLPEEWNVLAFTWTHNPATPVSECPALRGKPAGPLRPKGDSSAEAHWMPEDRGWRGSRLGLGDRRLRPLRVERGRRGRAVRAGDPG